MKWLARRRFEAEGAVIATLADRQWHYGLDMMREARLRSARFYTTIRRLEEADVIIGEFEANPLPGHKYRRRMYRLARVDA